MYSISELLLLSYLMSQKQHIMVHFLPCSPVLLHSQIETRKRLVYSCSSPPKSQLKSPCCFNCRKDGLIPPLHTEHISRILPRLWRFQAGAEVWFSSSPLSPVSCCHGLSCLLVIFICPTCCFCSFHINLDMKFILLLNFYKETHSHKAVVVHNTLYQDIGGFICSNAKKLNFIWFSVSFIKNNISIPSSRIIFLNTSLPQKLFQTHINFLASLFTLLFTYPKFLIISKAKH